MITKRASGPVTAQPRELLESAIGRARAAGRDDLVERLTRARRSLRERSVLAVGTREGRSELVDSMRSAAAGLAGVAFVDDEASGIDPIREIDAVLFVTGAAAALTGAELDLLSGLRAGRGPVLLALAEIDLYARWRDVFEANLARLRAAGIPVEPFAVSSRMHARATATNDRELDAASGVTTLAQRLGAIAADATARRARSVLHEVRGVLAELEAAPASTGAAVPEPEPAPAPSVVAPPVEWPSIVLPPEAMPTRPAAVRPRPAASPRPAVSSRPAASPRPAAVTRPAAVRPPITPAVSLLAAVPPPLAGRPAVAAPPSSGPDSSPERGPRMTKPAPAARPPWAQVLRDGFAAATSDVDFDLRIRTRTVLAEAELFIDDGDPADGWVRFDTWLRERLVREAEQTCMVLADRVAAVSADLAERLGGPGPCAVPPPPRPTIAGLFDHVPARPLSTGDRPLAARGRTLLMSAYGGVMMAFVLPRLAGLAIPAWLLGGAALITAIALTAATLTGERRRGLDRRRGQARTIVRNAIEGFLLSAGKHTRDALRVAQHQLRDDCAARAGELRSSPGGADRPRVRRVPDPSPEPALPRPA